MWLMTYVGAVFNGITVLILGRPNVPLLASHLNLRGIFNLRGTKIASILVKGKPIENESDVDFKNDCNDLILGVFFSS